MLVNRTTGTALATRVTRCDTFWTRLRGLMFRAPLAADEAYLFSHDGESIAQTSIHMFFVPYPIAVVWLDAQYRVVDATLARPWRPYYAPRAPAQFYVEATPALLDRVSVGDALSVEEPG